MADQSLVGTLGRVSTAVRGGEKPGEVRVVVSGLPHFYLAYCPQAIATGTEVVVVNNRGSRCLDVEPWSLANPWADPVPDL